MAKASAQRSQAKTTSNQTPHLHTKHVSKNRQALHDRLHPSSRGAHTGPSDHLLRLQGMLGNRAVGHFLQAKLTISQPHDPYEREADHVADTVMRMPEPEAPEDEATPMQPTPLVPRITPLVQRASEVDEEEAVEAQPTLQRETEAGTKEEEENVVATQPLIQRIPESELEEGAEEEAGGGTPSIQRMQAQGPEEDEEKGVMTKPVIQRQAKEEEEALQTKGLPGQFPRPGVNPFPPSSSLPGSHLQRVCSACDAEMRRQPAEEDGLVQTKPVACQHVGTQAPGG